MNKRQDTGVYHLPAGEYLTVEVTHSKTFAAYSHRAQAVGTNLGAYGTSARQAYTLAHQFARRDARLKRLRWLDQAYATDRRAEEGF